MTRFGFVFVAVATLASAGLFSCGGDDDTPSADASEDADAAAGDTDAATEIDADVGPRTLDWTMSEVSVDFTGTELELTGAGAPIIMAGAKLITVEGETFTEHPHEIEGISLKEIVIDDDDLVHLAAEEAADKTVHYVTWDGTDFVDTELVGSDTNRFGLDLALGTDGTPHLVWITTGNVVTYAARDDEGNFVSETIDDTVEAAAHTTLAVGDDGTVHVAYRATVDGGTALELRYATRTAGIWSVTTVPTTMASGNKAELALDPEGRPQLVSTIGDGSSEAGAFWLHLDDTDSWVEDVTPRTQSLQVLHMALDAEGRPHIVASGPSLGFFFWDGSAWVEVANMAAYGADIAVHDDGTVYLTAAVSGGGGYRLHLGRY